MGTKEGKKKTDNQEDDDLVGKLMTHLVSLNQTEYPSYLQDKINRQYFDNDSDLAKAISLMELFQKLETSREDGKEDDSKDDGGKDGNDNQHQHIAPYTCEYLQF